MRLFAGAVKHPGGLSFDISRPESNYLRSSFDISRPDSDYLRLFAGAVKHPGASSFDISKLWGKDVQLIQNIWMVNMEIIWYWVRALCVVCSNSTLQYAPIPP